MVETHPRGRLVAAFLFGAFWFGLGDYYWINGGVSATHAAVVGAAFGASLVLLDVIQTALRA